MKQTREVRAILREIDKREKKLMPDRQPKKWTVMNIERRYSLMSLRNWITNPKP